MRRQILDRMVLVLLGIGAGLVAVPGCGTDASGDPNPSTAAAVSSVEGTVKPAASAPNAASSKNGDTISRRQHQKSKK